MTMLSRYDNLKKIVKGLYLAVSLFTCLWSANAANMNLLKNPGFEQTADGKPLQWTNEIITTEENFSGLRAGKIICKEAAARTQQFNLQTGLTTLYGTSLEMEFSCVLQAKNNSMNVNLYMESISDKYAIVAQATIPQERWVRFRLRFPVSEKPLAQPKVGIETSTSGELLIDDAFFGPASDAPCAEGETIGEFNNSASKWLVTPLPLNDNLLNNPRLTEKDANGLPLFWHSDDHAARVTTDRAFQLWNMAATPHPWIYEAPAGQLAQLPPETSLCFSASVTTNGNPSSLFSLDAEFLNDDAVVATHSTGKKNIYVGWQEDALYFSTPKVPFNKIRIRLTPCTPGQFSFAQPCLRQKEKQAESIEWKQDADNFVRILNLPIRNTFIPGEEPKSLTLQCYLPTDTLNLTLNEIGGKTILAEQWTGLPLGTVFEKDLPLPVLEAEKAYELIMESGKLSDCNFFRIHAPQTKGATFDENRWMILDGKPFFPIGLNFIPFDNPDFFRVCKESGFNSLGFYYVFCEQTEFAWPRVQEQLIKYDLASFYWNSFAQEQRSDEILTQNARQLNTKLAQLPKFIGFMDDESCFLKKGNYKQARRGSGIYFRECPDYILWENHAPRIHPREDKNQGTYFPIVRRFADSMDVLSVDIYPVPAPGAGHNDLPNRGLSCVGDYAELVDATGWNRKPVWMILQGWGWGESRGAKNLDNLPRPNYHELRFMAYDAIIHGATGIDWHTEGGQGHGPCSEVYSEYWRDFAFVNQELSIAGDYLAGSIPEKTDYSQGRVKCRVWHNNGKSILIVLNESETEDASFEFPLNGEFYQTLNGNSCHRGDTFQLKPYDVLIFTTSPHRLSRPALFTPQPSDIPPIWEKKKNTVDALWMYPGQRTSGSEYMKVTFDLAEIPAVARIHCVCAPEWRLHINGQYVESGSNYFIGYDFDVARFLKPGKNDLVMELLWRPGEEKAMALTLTDGNGKRLAQSDEQTLWSSDNVSWQPAVSCGKHGPDCTGKTGRGAFYLIKDDAQ